MATSRRVDSVAYGAAVNLFTRLVGVGLVLALTTLIARVGTETQGAFALFTSAEAIWLACWSGFGVALARRVSHHGENPRALTAAVVQACIALGMLGGLMLWALSAWGPAAYAPMWILALGAPLVLIAPTLSGLWLGEGRMVPMARLAVAPPLLALGAVLGLAALVPPLSLPGVLGAWTGGKALVGAAALWVLWHQGRLAKADYAALMQLLPMVTVIGMTNLVAMLNYRVGLFAIERASGLSTAGIYSIAIVVSELLWFVSGSLTQAAYSRIGTQDRGQAADITVRVTQLNVALLLPAGPLLWLVAWYVLPLALGPVYAASLLPLAILLPGVMLFGGGSALSAYFTNHVGKPQVPAQVALVTLLLNALLSMAWVLPWGMAGVAAAASLAYVFSVVSMAWVFARHARFPLSRVLWPGSRLGADLRAALRLGRTGA